jgi:hypothetical protein
VLHQKLRDSAIVTLNTLIRLYTKPDSKYRFFKVSAFTHMLIDVRLASSGEFMVHPEGVLMKTSDSAFELILQELLKQKNHLEELARENQQLRSQLADLREGRGISVDILGQRFSPDTNSLEPLATLQRPSVTDKAPGKAISAASIPDALPIEYEPDREEITPTPSPTFLEEMIFDELASAATSPLAVWNDSATGSSLQAEEEKAALRDELTDSYLLG